VKLRDVRQGDAVVLHLHSPKEKIWGLLVSLSSAGVGLFGLDVAVFEDWLRQEARGEEPLVGPVSLFYPMYRLERLELDVSVGPVRGLADRFTEEVGRSVQEALGLEDARD
jgi:hypothetical protein